MTGGRESRFQVVSVSGYGSSGGSAGRDFLKNFESTLCFPTEFRFPREHGGLFDLMNSLERSTSPENSDLAIRDFAWLANKYARGGRARQLKRPGVRWDEFTGGSFSEAASDFIERITGYTYPIDWFYFDFEKPFPKYLLELALRKFVNSKFEQTARMWTHDMEDLQEASRAFLQAVVEGFIHQQRPLRNPVVVLHNFFSSRGPHELSLIKQLIPGIKFIIVDRDPRDIFWSYKSSRYLPVTSDRQERAQAFVAFFKERRQDFPHTSNDDAVMHVKFENLVTNTAEVGRAIYDFLGRSLDSEKQVADFFTPTESAKSIGLWRNLEGADGDVVNIIQSELADFIHD